MARASFASRFTGIALIATVFTSAGCYHAIVDTGRSPSNEVVVREWAHGFLWGLVPPETVTTAEQCSDGVARVETMHSFLNSLASALTWGIYTPITIRATCAGGDDNDAAGAADVLVPASATRAQRTEAMARAVTLSAQRQAPVYVRFSTH